MDGFEEMQGIPNVCGAIDGSLIRIKRFEDHTGFYSRKGTTALNVQAVVNHRGQFISHSIRSGSQNDKACFNNSQFGNHCHQFMPELWGWGDSAENKFFSEFYSRPEQSWFGK